MVILAGCLISANPTPLPVPNDMAASRPSPAIQAEEATAAVTLWRDSASGPSPEAMAAGTAPAPLAHPFELVSLDSLFAFLEDLTAIQPYSGWRDSATQGEAEALTYVVEKLQELTYLQGQGLSMERQSFRVPCSTEVWETRLYLSVNGQEIEVPADAPRGFHKDVALALRFDSDGEIDDSQRDPVTATGPAMVIDSVELVQSLQHRDVAGKVLVVNYAALDVIVLGGRQLTYFAARDLLALRPAGLVLVTSFSNEPGKSHGSFVADSNPLSWVPSDKETPAIPTLYVRLEDLAGAGIDDWDDLSKVRRLGTGPFGQPDRPHPGRRSLAGSDPGSAH
jgi:hypothetical protein